MADTRKSKGGCLWKLLLLVTISSAVLTTVAIIFMLMPQDLSDIQGHRADGGSTKPRDLQMVLQKALDGKYQVTLTEKEINLWLADTLEVEQRGLLADYVKMGRVLVRLEDGVAEIIIERTVFGRRATQSMYLQFKQTKGSSGLRTEILMHDGPYHRVIPYFRRGGHYGSLVVPQGYLYLVQPAYAELADVCKDELRLGFEEMVGIRIEEGQLILNPTGLVNSTEVIPK